MKLNPIKDMTVYSEKVTSSRFVAAVGAVSLALTLGSAHGATLTSVPMQGGMLMPDVWYHADTTNVTVDLSMMDGVAQLTPLQASNPNDSFHPGDPWFDSLDPSRQGLAFNLQYGFAMDPDTDMLPDGQQLWIRDITNSPNLGIYNYSTTPKLWAPIFGTNGSTNATYWSGMMWMLAATAPPGTNNFSATFEVYVVDTTTGKEVPGSSSGPFILNWTDVPDGRSQLTIAAAATNGLVLTWPASATNWTLVSTTDLTPANWTFVTNLPVASNGQAAVYLEGAAAQQFFTMLRNP
jgi:hypothetical protein